MLLIINQIISLDVKGWIKRKKHFLRKNCAPSTLKLLARSEDLFVKTNEKQSIHMNHVALCKNSF